MHFECFPIHIKLTLSNIYILSSIVFFSFLSVLNITSETFLLNIFTTILMTLRFRIWILSSECNVFKSLCSMKRKKCTFWSLASNIRYLERTNHILTTIWNEKKHNYEWCQNHSLKFRYLGTKNIEWLSTLSALAHWTVVVLVAVSVGGGL